MVKLASGIARGHLHATTSMPVWSVLWTQVLRSLRLCVFLEISADQVLLSFQLDRGLKPGYM